MLQEIVLLASEEVCVTILEDLSLPFTTRIWNCPDFGKIYTVKRFRRWRPGRDSK
jgi:hypothetical protein